MVNFGHFAGFSIFSPKIRLRLTLEWLNSPNSQLFPSFTTKVSHFWRNLKKFHPWGRGRYINKYIEFFQPFSNHFTSEAPQSDPQWWILPNQSGLDWFKMANFVILQVFPSFLPKWGSDWLGMANFTWFTTFPIFYHQSVSFLEKSQNFLFLRGGGVHWPYLLNSSTFFESFHTEAAQNDTQWPILPNKWLRLAPNGQFWSFCRFIYLFSKMRLRLTLEWPILPDSQLSPSFATKVSHFWRNIKSLSFHRGGTSANFLSFSTFSNCFTPERLKMIHNGEICHQSGLDWAQNGPILVKFQQKLKYLSGIFSNLQNEALDWLRMANFTRFTGLSPCFCHQSISWKLGDISAKFSFHGEGYTSKFLSFSTFSNHFTPKQLKMTHNGQFCHQSGLDELKMGNFG